MKSDEINRQEYLEAVKFVHNPMSTQDKRTVDPKYLQGLGTTAAS